MSIWVKLAISTKRVSVNKSNITAVRDVFSNKQTTHLLGSFGDIPQTFHFNPQSIDGPAFFSLPNRKNPLSDRDVLRAASAAWRPRGGDETLVGFDCHWLLGGKRWLACEPVEPVEWHCCCFVFWFVTGLVPSGSRRNIIRCLEYVLHCTIKQRVITCHRHRRS